MSIFSSIVIFHLSFLKLGQIPNSVTKHSILVLTNVWSLRAKKISEKIRMKEQILILFLSIFWVGNWDRLETKVVFAFLKFKEKIFRNAR